MTVEESSILGSTKSISSFKKDMYTTKGGMVGYDKAIENNRVSFAG